MLGVLVLTAAAVAAIIGALPTVIAVPCGLLLVFVLPGSVWTRVVRPPRDTAFAYGSFVVATSMALTMVVGVLINFLPAGLTKTDWCLGQAAVIGLGAIAALLRGDPPAPSVTWTWPAPRAGLGIALKLLSLSVLVGAAVVISINSGTQHDQAEHFTALTIRANGEHPVVGIYDHEGVAIDYVLKAHVNTRLVFSRRVRVVSGATAQVRLVVPAPSVRGGGILKVTLDRPGRAGTYRSVWLLGRLGTWQ